MNVTENSSENQGGDELVVSSKISTPNKLGNDSIFSHNINKSACSQSQIEAEKQLATFLHRKIAEILLATKKKLLRSPFVLKYC